nr:DNA translocase FtsK [Pseudomonas azerbaijanoccidentalis]
MLPAAIAFVRVSRRATVAALQRHFNINYNRGARLIERMQADGVVSPANDKGARTVL